MNVFYLPEYLSTNLLLQYLYSSYKPGKKEKKDRKRK